MGQITINLNLLFSFLFIVSQVLSGSAYAVVLSNTNAQKVHAGYKPSDSNGLVNLEFFMWFYVLALCIVSFFFVIVEIALIFKLSYTKMFEVCIIRGAIYLFKGIATLGVAGDLGIAAAAFEFLSALILIVLEVIARRSPAKE